MYGGSPRGCLFALELRAFQDRLRHDRSALRIQVKADSQAVIDFSHMRLICFSKIPDYLRLIDRYRLLRLTHGNLFQSALLFQHIMCRLVQLLKFRCQRESIQASVC